MHVFKSEPGHPQYGAIPTFEADFASGKVRGGKADGAGHDGHDDMKEMEFEPKRRVLPFGENPPTTWERMARFCYNVRLNWKRELAVVIGIVLVVLILIIVARVGGLTRMKHEKQ
jgi:hypothetical protein